MFRKVTAFTDTLLEKIFREQFPVGSLYLQAYVRSLMVVSHIVGKADGFPFGSPPANDQLKWLERPTSEEGVLLTNALADCARVEAVIGLDDSEQDLCVDISMLRGKIRYGYVSLTVSVFQKVERGDLAYATLTEWNFERRRVD